MSIAVQGIVLSLLDPIQQRALAILRNVTEADLARLKHLMHLGLPAVIGEQTLDAFMQLCADRELDLSAEGVSAFKLKHGLGDTGANKGAIGSSTAAAYAQALLDLTPQASPNRKVTVKGLKIVENFEGLSLTAYRDQVGVLTIGWGHTANVRPGQVITQGQAEDLLRGDMAIAEEAVSNLVKVELTDNQFNALTSFTFNAGTGALASSSVLRKLNAGDYAGAADALLLWNKGMVRGELRPIPGLTARRSEERALFLS